MRFLITGAAGFLGSALANRLVDEGHTVRGLDDLSTGSPDVLRPDVFLTRGDINDRPKLWTLLQDVDCVYHLAARVSVPESVLYPREYNLVNVGGTVTLMEAMRDVGVRRVVFISSGAVYGDQTDQPLAEAAAAQPALALRRLETCRRILCPHHRAAVGHRNGLPARLQRLWAGPASAPVHAPVIPYFLRQAWNQGTLVVHGDGTQTRDYVYVDDVVQAAVSAAAAPDINQRIINVGSGIETPVRELVRLVIEVTGGSPEVIYNPRNEGGVRRMCADLTLAQQYLGYRPTVSLTDGLRMTLEQNPRLRMK